MRHLLVDTGPLVALLDRSDQYHSWAVQRFRELAPPLLTCESVLSEACYLLRNMPRSSRALARLQREEIISVPFDFQKEAPAVWKLKNKYADVPIDLADACLIRMTELYPECRLWTLDSDFRIYRRLGRRSIPLIYPK
jgi:predicted nucleic acid-binding protein